MAEDVMAKIVLRLHPIILAPAASGHLGVQRREEQVL